MDRMDGVGIAIPDRLVPVFATEPREGGSLADRVPGEDLDAAGVTGRGGFDPTASAGLFVGVSTFEDERILEIPYAVDDAVDLAHLFAIELGLVAPERAVLLLAGEAKKAAS